MQAVTQSRLSAIKGEGKCTNSHRDLLMSINTWDIQPIHSYQREISGTLIWALPFSLPFLLRLPWSSLEQQPFKFQPNYPVPRPWRKPHHTSYVFIQFYHWAWKTEVIPPSVGLSSALVRPLMGRQRPLKEISWWWRHCADMVSAFSPLCCEIP